MLTCIIHLHWPTWLLFKIHDKWRCYMLMLQKAWVFCNWVAWQAHRYYSLTERIEWSLAYWLSSLFTFSGENSLLFFGTCLLNMWCLSFRNLSKERRKRKNKQMVSNFVKAARLLILFWGLSHSRIQGASTCMRGALTYKLQFNNDFLCTNNNNCCWSASFFWY